MPLQDKDVLKGAPPPPESFAETMPVVKKFVKPDMHVVSSDGAQAIKKAVRTIKNVPHAVVVHKRKDYAHVVRIPMSTLTKKMRERVALLPTTNSRTFRMKAGGNMSEYTFSAVKRNLCRMNLRRSTTRASLNMLSASWLTKNVGLVGVVKAIKIYQDAITDEIAPVDAFTSTAWLKHNEPMA